METKKLQKPQFVKVINLENGRNGYNVYVKVMSAENSKTESGNLEIVRAVVGDETGCANAFFKGDTAKLLKKDAVVAIRNGIVRLMKGHISLEVDVFGRVTE
jgi:ssDNA-binding replication factor A large subunit